MNRFSSRHMFLLLLVLLALPALACSAIGSDATETPAATAPPAPTNTPEATATPASTATPEATATLEPTATPEIGADFTPYESGVVGVAFSYPADWAILDLFFIAVASDEGLLEDTTGVEDGALIAIIAGDSADVPAGTSEEQLEEALANLEFEEATLIDGPTETEIQGQEAALATFEAVAEDGTQLTIRVAIIFSGNRTAVVTGITPTGVVDAYMPTIQAVIETVEVFEPTEEDPFGNFLGGDDTPAGELIPFETGQIAEGAIPDGSFQDYLFQGVNGEPLIIAVNPDEAFDIELEIYPVGDENSLLADADDGFPGEAEVLVFVPEADGEYIVRVSGFAGASGDYIITMLDPIQGITIEGTVADDEVSAVRVCVPAGEPIIAAIFPDDDFDPVLNLNGPAGGQLIDEIDNGASGDPEVIFFTAGMDEFDEDYPVIINLEGFAGFGGSYILYVGPAGVVQDGC